MATAFLRCVGFLFLLKFLTALGQGAWLCSQPCFHVYSMLGVFLALVLILFYNGEKGRF